MCPTTLSRLLFLVSFGVASLAFGHPIAVDVNAYPGAWTVDNVKRTGNATIDLATGSHTFFIGGLGAFGATIDASGAASITINPDAAEATGSAIKFLTAPVTIDTNGYIGRWSVLDATSNFTGSRTLNLVKNHSYPISIGPTGAFQFRFDASGAASITINPDAAEAISSTVRFVTTPVTIDTAGYLGRWNIFDTTAVFTGSRTLSLVRSHSYGVSIGLLGSIGFQISASGSLSIASNQDAAELSGSTLRFLTSLVKVDVGSFTGAWNLFDTTAVFTGDQTLSLVRSNTYRLATSTEGANFVLSPTCTVTPPTLSLSGSLFQVSCVSLDTDADGVLDTADNCPSTPNADQSNLDADALGDACDADDDNDGVIDVADNCPAVSNSGQEDLDGDSRGDLCDLDVDGDGVDDLDDNCIFEVNPSQDDLDGDIIGDICDPDLDGDGADNQVDNCAEMSNPTQSDLDGDTFGDECDPDDDGDGFDDLVDNCPFVANLQSDNDNDALGDACDLDDDNDGVFDVVDNCTLVANAGQRNLDSDAQGDACDLDDDNDGVLDVVDNCVEVVNPTQVDQDLDGQGNLCDSDLDGDTIDNAEDNCPDVENESQLNQDQDALGDACDNDADGDLINDTNDNCIGVSNPSQGDSDQDALGDACDLDDDNDGVLDAVDNCALIPNPEQRDYNQDGEGDACDGDTDGDGVGNGNDLCAATPLGNATNANGCDGVQFVKLSCVEGAFVNHGAYVSCVVQAANQAFAEGLLTAQEKASIVAAAARKPKKSHRKSEKTHQSHKNKGSNR